MKFLIFLFLCFTVVTPHSSCDQNHDLDSCVLNNIFYSCKYVKINHGCYCVDADSNAGSETCTGAEEKHNEISQTAIIVIVLTVVVCFALIAVAMRYSRKKPEENKQTETKPLLTGPSPGFIFPQTHQPQNYSYVPPLYQPQNYAYATPPGYMPTPNTQNTGYYVQNIPNPG